MDDVAVLIDVVVVVVVVVVPVVDVVEVLVVEVDEVPLVELVLVPGLPPPPPHAASIATRTKAPNSCVNFICRFPQPVMCSRVNALQYGPTPFSV
jgi:hypothetical protein